MVAIKSEEGDEKLSATIAKTNNLLKESELSAAQELKIINVILQSIKVKKFNTSHSMTLNLRENVL